MQGFAFVGVFVLTVILLCVCWVLFFCIVSAIEDEKTSAFVAGFITLLVASLAISSLYLVAKQPKARQDNKPPVIVTERGIK